uniref:Uncharacterized protein n=1 Tax=Parascaris equorum TaxID=6256 RepID=A0A914RZY7_PAREQ
MKCGQVSLKGDFIDCSQVEMGVRYSDWRFCSVNDSTEVLLICLIDVTLGDRGEVISEMSSLGTLPLSAERVDGRTINAEISAQC